MNKFLSFLAFLLLSTAAIADTTSARQELKEAYNAYKTAMASNQRADAKAAAARAYEAGKTVLPGDSKQLAALALNYGRLHTGSEAEDILTHALEIMERAYGNEALELVDPLMALAKEKASLGRLSRSTRLYQRAMEIVTRHEGEDSFLMGMVHLQMGEIAVADAASGTADHYLEKAISIFETIDGDTPRFQAALAKFWIAKVRLAEDKPKAAIDLFLQALNSFDRIQPNSQIVLTTHAFLIEAYERRGMRNEATEHCLAIGQATPVKPDQDYMPVYKAMPTYPSSALRAGITGHALLSVTVDKDGFARNPIVLEVEGSDSFAEAALKTIERFRYAPRFVDGAPVETDDVTYKFTFDITH